VLRRRFERILAGPPSWLWPVLVPLSLLYAGGSAFHRGLYRLGILKSRNLPRPVVSVGNLTVGGAGKTPIVMWLAEALSNRGIRPAILSRGYGREGAGIRVVDPDGPWRIFGDEPTMMARKLAEVPVVVSGDRRRAGLNLLQHKDVDLFILDDGFQHHALKRDLDIVAIDNHRRFGTGRLLPAGILREPVKRLQDADIVVVTKVVIPDSNFEKELTRLKDVPVVWFDFRPAGLVPLDPSTETTETDASSGSALAFCGIAHPDGFRQSLKRAGIEVAGFITFPDHHTYSVEDISRIKAAARETGVRRLVTTEKDAVRWPDHDPEIPVYFLSMETIPLQGEEKIMRILQDLVLKG
jgi:tetraacyldisaccharide 4'-kinase